jgi:hypothetical protein
MSFYPKREGRREGEAKEARQEMRRGRRGQKKN